MKIELTEEAISQLVEKGLIQAPTIEANGYQPTGYLRTNVIIRTVTHYFTGHLIEEGPNWLILTDAAWVADTGRWADALEKGTLNEVEPYPDGVRVNTSSVIDISEWNRSLIVVQK